MAYVSHLEVTFTNDSGEPLQVPNFYVYTGSAAPVHQRDLPTYTGFGWMRGDKFTFKDSNSFGGGGFLGMGRTEQPFFSEQQADGAWAGVSNQYFTSIITPEKRGAGVWAHRFPIDRDLVGTATWPAKPTALVASPNPMNGGGRCDSGARLPADARGKARR